ncbi:MAG: hypothetical protein KAG14_02695 [Mycoplasmataceae bacterium]|nr:hypothetical protein [Mycoplasmataceae bacterium]
MVIWIIIGSLIGIVGIFLITMTIMDKKKAKKHKIKIKELEIKKQESKDDVILFLVAVIEKNGKLLKNFKPSIGEYKMGDIRGAAHKSLKIFKQTSSYKLAKDGENNKDLMQTYDNFFSENSNLWFKKFEKEISNLKISSKKISSEVIEKNKKQISEIIKKAENNEPT